MARGVPLACLSVVVRDVRDIRDMGDMREGRDECYGRNTFSPSPPNVVHVPSAQKATPSVTLRVVASPSQRGRPIGEPAAMKRTTGLLLAVAVSAVGACTSDVSTETSATSIAPAPTTTVSTTTTSSTTTTIQPTTTTLSEEQLHAIQLEEDGKRIRQLWRGFSDAWVRGIAAGYSYMADYSHPDMGCAAEEYRNLHNFPEGYAMEVVVLADTVERDPEWISPDLDEVPGGRLYIFQATMNSTVKAELTASCRKPIAVGLSPRPGRQVP